MMLIHNGNGKTIIYLLQTAWIKFNCWCIFERRRPVTANDFVCVCVRFCYYLLLLLLVFVYLNRFTLFIWRFFFFHFGWFIRHTRIQYCFRTENNTADRGLFRFTLGSGLSFSLLYRSDCLVVATVCACVFHCHALSLSISRIHTRTHMLLSWLLFFLLQKFQCKLQFDHNSMLQIRITLHDRTSTRFIYRIVKRWSSTVCT